MLLETPQSAPHLKVGNAVEVLFKETEVSLAKELRRPDQPAQPCARHRAADYGAATS